MRGDVLRCPDCDVALQRDPFQIGAGYRCPGCDGRSTTLDALRPLLGRASTLLWRAAVNGAPTGTRSCPACAHAMKLFASSGRPQLDVCARCHLVWLDAGEIESLAARAPAGATLHVDSPERRQLFARLEAELQAELARGERREARDEEIPLDRVGELVDLIADLLQ